jgi:small GTP-binding protein
MNKSIFIIKCILLGNAGVGKTSLVAKYTCNSFDNNETSTIGVDYRTKEVIIDDDTKYILQIWDTAGQERFNSIVKTYYNHTNCVIFCFSLIDPETFLNLKKIINEFNNNIDHNHVKVLVGTFHDKLDQTYIPEFEIGCLINDYDIDAYYTVSSKTGFNVDRLFESIMNKTIKASRCRQVNLTSCPDPDIIHKKSDDCCT